MEAYQEHKRRARRELTVLLDAFLLSGTLTLRDKNATPAEEPTA